MKRPLVRRPGYESCLVIDGEKMSVASQEDCTAAIEQAKILEEVARPGEEFRHVCKVPRTVRQKAMDEGWDDGDWAKWLNDPDHVKLRSWKGQIGRQDLM